MFRFVKFRKNEKSTETINDIYFKSINFIHKSPEYIQNQIYINNLKQIISRQAGISGNLIDWLIEYVEENTAIEYEYANKEIYKHLLK